VSGPYDVPEDPDDVTLWAGRLRAWPTPPGGASDSVDDEIDDATAVSPRQIADDTVRVDRPAPRAESAHDAVPPPGDEPADETTLSGRRRSLPSADHPVPDDTTVATRPRAVVPPDDAAADALDATPTSETAAGTRRARSRGGVSTAALSSGVPVPTPREARPPGADREIYRPRADEAVRVARSAPPARPGDAPDAAEIFPRTSRRVRRRGLALALTVVVLVAAAAIGLFLLMG
jgi:hypothetical protein